MTQQPGDWKKTSYPQREEVRKRAPVFRAEHERGGRCGRAETMEDIHTKPPSAIRPTARTKKKEQGTGRQIGDKREHYMFLFQMERQSPFQKGEALQPAGNNKRPTELAVSVTEKGHSGLVTC